MRQTEQALSKTYLRNLSVYVLLLILLFSIICCGGKNSRSDTDGDKSDEENKNDTVSEYGNDSQNELSDSDTDVSEAVFIKQPAKMNIAPNNRTVTLVCEVKAEGRSINYQWYESIDGSTDTGTTIADATDPAFETPVFTEKGIHFYYCTATVSDSSGGNETTLVSNIASVARTALPTLYITTPDKAVIDSKEEWVENTVISLVGSPDKSWNFDKVAANISGRGNTTWLLPKKPYNIKLDKKQKIMGSPAHKRWVLIANYLDNSFMRNATALYLSGLFEMDWTVHGSFVDLVLNEEYQGLYWLGEAIKVDKNRINIYDGNSGITDDEDKDYLVEMDKYYDEPVKFRSSVRNLPYMIKNDDYMIDENSVISSGGTARLERFQAKIDTLERILYPDFTNEMDTNTCSAPDESYAEVIDIDSWVKFWFVNEIMDNTELGHPKSCYFTFDSTNNIFKAGPVWDFDWASLHNRSSCTLKNTLYYNALFKSPAFKTRVKELWNKYSAGIDVESLIESMRSELSVAAVYDTMLWGEHNDPSGVKRENFDAYVDFLKERILDKISIINADVAAME